MSARPSGDGLIDSGANVGMSSEESILVGIHSIEAIPLGLALTPFDPLHISYCTRMGYLPLLLADDDVLLVPTLVNPASTKTTISPECVMKSSSNIVRWEQHGFCDGSPGRHWIGGKRGEIIVGNQHVAQWEMRTFLVTGEGEKIFFHSTRNRQLSLLLLLS
jgi:hypothetical protein